MERGRKKILCAVVAVVTICVVFAAGYFSQPRRREPVYQGKTLTNWLRQLDDHEVFGISSYKLPSPTRRQLEAAQAIRAMGAAALPLLMEDIHARPADNAFRIRLHRWLNAHLASALSGQLWFLDVTEEDRRRWRAAQGLAALGPLAKPALPELKRLFSVNIWHSSVKEAAYALATIEPEGVEILTNSIQRQADWSSMCAIWSLGQHPAAGTNFIPLLIKATSSSDEWTACGAIEVLSLFHVNADQVVPALTNALVSNNTAVSGAAALALGKFGRQATSALPLLQSMTNNATLKAAALRALKQIY
ncbi:MAG: HEAT repeat domain-containing protein [Limisphaerales bacterium]